MIALAVSALAGIAIGLRCKVKLLIVVTALTLVGHFGFGVITGSIGSSLLWGLGGAVALQVGYFVALVAQMLGLTREQTLGGGSRPEPVAVRPVSRAG